MKSPLHLVTNPMVLLQNPSKSPLLLLTIPMVLFRNQTNHLRDSYHSLGKMA